MIFKQPVRMCDLVIILICGLLISCGPSPEDQAAASATPATTADIDWTIPANISTYTDETGTFSISYPSDWKVDFSMFTELHTIAKEGLKSIDSDLQISVEQIGGVFFAGIPCGTGCYQPSFNINFGPWEPDFKSIDALVTYNLSTPFFEGFHEVSRETTIIDGRDAVILELEAFVEELGMNYHSLQMITVEGEIIWYVTCGLFEELVDYAEYEDDFQNIVRSFQIH